MRETRMPGSTLQRTKDDDILITQKLSQQVIDRFITTAKSDGAEMLSIHAMESFSRFAWDTSQDEVLALTKRCT